MTSIQEHENNIKQFIDDINDKIKANLLVERQKIVAFAASEAAANMMELYLHKKNVISSGFKVNHSFFSSEKRAERFLNFDFPNKKRIIALMIEQEKYRNLLCYGKEKDDKKIREAVNNMNNLKEVIEKDLGEKI